MSVRKVRRAGEGTNPAQEFWIVDFVYRSADGRRRRIRRVSPSNTRRGAEEYERQTRAALVDGRFDREEAPTLAEFVPRFMEGYVKANRQKHSTQVSKESNLRIHLLPALGHRRLDELRAEDIQRLKGAMAEKNPKTVNNVLSTLSKLLKVAVEWEVIDRVPTRIQLLKVHIGPSEFYDDDDYARLVEGAAKVGTDVEAAIRLAGEAGLRAGEIIALEWSDLDLRRQQLTVQRSEWRGVVGSPKSGKDRRVPMTRQLADAVQALRHLKGPRLFYVQGGGTLTPHVLRDMVEAAQRRAGLKVTGKIHMLRHTFCSRLAMKGAPARAIQELAGHAHLSTTQRYMHLSPAAVDGAIRLLEVQGKGNVMATPGDLSANPA